MASGSLTVSAPRIDTRQAGSDAFQRTALLAVRTRDVVAALAETTRATDHRYVEVDAGKLNRSRLTVLVDPLRFGHEHRLAEGNPAIEALGITTIGGNQTLEKVTRNARTVLTVTDFRAPIPADCTTQFAVTLDHGKFWDPVVEAIEAVPGR